MRQPEPQLKSHKLPEGWHCPACGLLLEGATPLLQNPQSRMKKGHVIVCGGCSVVNIVGDGGLRQMSNDEIDKLPNDVICQLQITVQKIRNIIEQAGKN